MFERSKVKSKTTDEPKGKQYTCGRVNNPNNKKLLEAHKEKTDSRRER